MVHDPMVKNVVVDQTKQWSEMVTKQRKEELEMRKQHLQVGLKSQKNVPRFLNQFFFFQVQEEVLRRQMEQLQAQQLKELEAAARTGTKAAE